MKLTKDFYTDPITLTEVFEHRAEIEGQVLIASVRRSTFEGGPPLKYIELELRDHMAREVLRQLYKGVR